MTYTVKQFIQDLRSRYTSVGSYPTFFATGEGDCLCHVCARAEALERGRAIRDQEHEAIEGCHVNWESRVYCAECSEQIEAAYEVVS